MRIIKFVFFSLIGLLVFAFLGFFIGREILLTWGSTMIRADYNSLLKQNYADKCSQRFAYNQEYWVQLRFTSNKAYNLEVVCADFTASPILLASKKLPPLVYKTSFGSGFIVSDQLPAWIEISALGRKLFIYTDAKEIHSGYLSKPDLDYDDGPPTVCQAYNYQCCSLDLESGLGTQITTATDCPKSCYESCLLRPIILSFSSTPAFDGVTRIVEINSGEAVTFSYVLGNGKEDAFAGQISKTITDQESFWDKLQTIFATKSTTPKDNGIALPIAVSVSFGDGNIYQSANLQDTFDHVYVCQTRICYFQAQITAQDARGVLSVDNELANMVVKVNR